MPESLVDQANASRRWDPAEARRALRLGALAGAWVGAIGLATYALYFYIGKVGVGFDAHAYWVAGRVSDPYHEAPGFRDAFLYSPVFAQAVRPLALLPWPAFLTVWMVADSAAYVWLTSGMRWWWRVPLLLFCLPEVLIGNVYGFFGVVAVLGFRFPELWALPLLTKITPGGIGLLWFLARGEWRHLTRAVLFTAGLAAVSFAIAPTLWREWGSFLRDQSGSGGPWILVRTAVACLVIVVAARSGKRWVLPMMMGLATPVQNGSNLVLALLPPTLRLARRSPQPGESVADPTPTDHERRPAIS